MPQLPNQNAKRNGDQALSSDHFHEGIFISHDSRPRLGTPAPRSRSHWTLLRIADQFRIRPNALRDTDDLTDLGLPRSGPVSTRVRALGTQFTGVVASWGPAGTPQLVKPHDIVKRFTLT